MYILEEEILPVNQKLKAVRKFLNIRQQELAGGKIDRSLISYIENGKIKLTKDTASILADSFKRIMKERDINFAIDTEYLLAVEEKQAGYIADSKIDILKKYLLDNDQRFPEELKDAEEFLDKWELPAKRARVYEIAGEYYYGKLEYSKSQIYYMGSKDDFIRDMDMENISSINTKAARCSLIKGNYEEAIHLNNFALSMLKKSNIHNEIIEKRALFNNALANFKLKKYDEGLSILDVLENRYGNFEQYKELDMLLLRGNIYYAKEEFINALKFYEKVKELAEKLEDRETLARSYSNIGKVHTEMGEIEKGMVYKKKSLEIREEINSVCLISSLESLAHSYFQMEDYIIAEEYLMMALEKAEGERDILNLINVYNRILDIYLKTGEKSISEDMVNKIVELGKSKNHLEKGQSLFIKLCNYYIDTDQNKVKELLKLAQENTAS